MADTRRWTKHLLNLLEKQEQRCYYCGQHIKIFDQTLKEKHGTPTNSATVDHVIPISNGGDSTSLDNLVAACHVCNTIKGSMPVCDFIALLDCNDVEFNKFIQSVTLKKEKGREKKSKKGYDKAVIYFVLLYKFYPKLTGELKKLKIKENNEPKKTPFCIKLKATRKRRQKNIHK